MVFLGDLLCLQQRSPLWSPDLSSGAPPSGLCGSFSRDRLAVVGELVVVAGAGWAARISLAQKLPETPGGPRASAGSQMGSQVLEWGGVGPGAPDLVLTC